MVCVMSIGNPEKITLHYRHLYENQYYIYESH